MHNNEFSRFPQERSLTLFEDRYGSGSFARLIAMLEQPCVTFAAIATHFGVSRERARQWHLAFLPDAPRGHQRQRLCLRQREKQKLLADSLFRTFYRHARPHFQSGAFVLIEAQEGFRKRTVRLNGRLVAIKIARALPQSARTQARSYALTNSAAIVDHIYYRLTDAEYLVVPRDLIPPSGTTFLDADTSRYVAYRNTFAAIGGARRPDEPRPATRDENGFAADTRQEHPCR
jgi:hypothetical protein